MPFSVNIDFLRKDKDSVLNPSIVKQNIALFEYIQYFKEIENAFSPVSFVYNIPTLFFTLYFNNPSKTHTLVKIKTTADISVIDVIK